MKKPIERFRKVWIKTEADLPKVQGYYAVHREVFASDYTYCEFWNNNTVFNKAWVENFDWYLLPEEGSEEEKHTTCDGCQMFSESGCMLDDSCSECIDRHQWTPKETQPNKEAEKILEDNLNEHLWTFISTYPVAYKADLMLKDWIIDAMQEYAEAYSKKSRREELIRFALEARKGYHKTSMLTDLTYWKFDVDSESKLVDEYLKTK